MLVRLIFLLILAGSADSGTEAPMPTVMPTQNPSDELMPTQNASDELMPTQNASDDHDSSARKVSGKQVCSFHDVVVHLDLREDNRRYMATRPVLNHTKATVVTLDVSPNAILDVIEKDLKFVSNMWIYMSWENEHVSWDPSEFCGIELISVPTAWLWKPDIVIKERLEMDKVVLSPYVEVTCNGTTFTHYSEVVVSTCIMNVYKFPFDTQSCDLTFASGIYNSEELQLKALFDNALTRYFAVMMIKDEYDWMFQNFSYVEYNASDFKSNRIVYTVTMKRKAVLYFINFLLPVLCFLCLDMASFLISDSGGEKLSFKVTVLLAVTVLQLILNDILPATSNRMPIIAMYCFGSFALMLLSLLETLLVTYLLEKDSQKTETDKDPSLKEDKTREKRRFYNDGPDGDDERDKTHELQSMTEEVHNLKGDSHGFQVILDELRDLEKNLRGFFRSKADGARPSGYWTRMATRINKAFFIIYVMTVAVFLIAIFSAWSPEY